jgi:hypothetical protein
MNNTVIATLETTRKHVYINHGDVYIHGYIYVNYTSKTPITCLPMLAQYWWLVGWLAGWLAGWLVGGLVGRTRLVGWLVGWLIG